VQKVSGLQAGQLGMPGNQGDGVALGHLRQQVQKHPQGGSRLRAVENLHSPARLSLSF
jgi:hypothetical protein